MFRDKGLSRNVRSLIDSNLLTREQLESKIAKKEEEQKKLTIEQEKLNIELEKKKNKIKKFKVDQRKRVYAEFNKLFAPDAYIEYSPSDKNYKIYCNSYLSSINPQDYNEKNSPLPSRHVQNLHHYLCSLLVNANGDDKDNKLNPLISLTQVPNKESIKEDAKHLRKYYFTIAQDHFHEIFQPIMESDTVLFQRYQAALDEIFSPGLFSVTYNSTTKEVSIAVDNSQATLAFLKRLKADLPQWDYVIDPLIQSKYKNQEISIAFSGVKGAQEFVENLEKSGKQNKEKAQALQNELSNYFSLNEIAVTWNYKNDSVICNFNRQEKVPIFDKLIVDNLFAYLKSRYPKLGQYTQTETLYSIEMELNNINALKAAYSNCITPIQKDANNYQTSLRKKFQNDNLSYTWDHTQQKFILNIPQEMLSLSMFLEIITRQNAVVNGQSSRFEIGLGDKDFAFYARAIQFWYEYSKVNKELFSPYFLKNPQNYRELYVDGAVAFYGQCIEKGNFTVNPKMDEFLDFIKGEKVSPLKKYNAYLQSQFANKEIGLRFTYSDEPYYYNDKPRYRTFFYEQEVTTEIETISYDKIILSSEEEEKQVPLYDSSSKSYSEEDTRPLSIDFDESNSEEQKSSEAETQQKKLVVNGMKPYSRQCYEPSVQLTLPKKGEDETLDGLSTFLKNIRFTHINHIELEHLEEIKKAIEFFRTYHTVMKGTMAHKVNRLTELYWKLVKKDDPLIINRLPTINGKAFSIINVEKGDNKKLDAFNLKVLQHYWQETKSYLPKDTFDFVAQELDLLNTNEEILFTQQNVDAFLKKINDYFKKNLIQGHPFLDALLKAVEPTSTWRRKDKKIKKPEVVDKFADAIEWTKVVLKPMDYDNVAINKKAYFSKKLHTQNFDFSYQLLENEDEGHFVFALPQGKHAALWEFLSQYFNKQNGFNISSEVKSATVGQQIKTNYIRFSPKKADRFFKAFDFWANCRGNHVANEVIYKNKDQQDAYIKKAILIYNALDEEKLNAFNIEEKNNELKKSFKHINLEFNIFNKSDLVDDDIDLVDGKDDQQPFVTLTLNKNEANDKEQDLFEFFTWLIKVNSIVGCLISEGNGDQKIYVPFDKLTQFFEAVNFYINYQPSLDAKAKKEGKISRILDTYDAYKMSRLSATDFQIIHEKLPSYNNSKPTFGLTREKGKEFFAPHELDMNYRSLLAWWKAACKQYSLSKKEKKLILCEIKTLFSNHSPRFIYTEGKINANNIGSVLRSIHLKVKTGQISRSAPVCDLTNILEDWARQGLATDSKKMNDYAKEYIEIQKRFLNSFSPDTHWIGSHMKDMIEVVNGADEPQVKSLPKQLQNIAKHYGVSNNFTRACNRFLFHSLDMMKIELFMKAVKHTNYYEGAEFVKGSLSVASFKQFMERLMDPIATNSKEKLQSLKINLKQRLTTPDALELYVDDSKKKIVELK